MTTNNRFVLLYADFFFEAANWHARQVKNLQTCRSCSEDCENIARKQCYHAGAAVEMFFKGILAKSNVRALWPQSHNSKRFSQCPNNQVQNIDDYQQLESGDIDIAVLANHLTVKMEVIKTNVKHIFQKNSLKYEIIEPLVESLVAARNISAHHAIAILKNNAAEGQLCLLRDVIRRYIGESSPEFQSLRSYVVYRDGYPALSEFLDEWLISHTMHPNDLLDNLSVLQLRKRYNTFIRKLRRNDNNIIRKNRYGGLQQHLQVLVIRCPRCTMPAFLICRSAPAYTAAEDLADQSPSILFSSERWSMNCPACTLTWGDIHLDYFSKGKIKTLQTLIPQTNVSTIHREWELSLHALIEQNLLNRSELRA